MLLMRHQGELGSLGLGSGSFSWCACVRVRVGVRACACVCVCILKQCVAFSSLLSWTSTVVSTTNSMMTITRKCILRVHVENV